MKIVRRMIGAVMILMTIGLTGCVNPDGTPNNAGTGALLGTFFGAATGAVVGRYTGNTAAGAAIGAATGALIGGLVGNQITQEQRTALQQNSPETWQAIQHNDQLAAQQQQQQQGPTFASNPGEPPSPAAPQADPPMPIRVDEIKAMTTAGIKASVIVDEINESKSTYSSTDVAAVQQVNPAIDPSVIACMQSHPS